MVVHTHHSFTIYLLLLSELHIILFHLHQRRAESGYCGEHTPPNSKWKLSLDVLLLLSGKCILLK